MHYVVRDPNGSVISLHREPVDGAELLPSNHPDVQAFLGQQGGRSFAEMDANLVRVLEDLIDALLRRRVERTKRCPPAHHSVAAAQCCSCPAPLCDSMAAVMFPFDLPPPEPDLPAQVVRAARTPEAASGVPASFDVVTAARLREMGPGLQLSEALVSVPGVVALARRNPAQDLQLSIRGFGARSTFGVRGVRLYEDGIPQTMPDGQGQTSGFDLGAAQRIEVLRGPASVLFGNAAGGVVQVFSPDAPDRPELRLGGVAGPDGLWRLATEVGAQVGDVNVSARSAWQGSEGWREHSASQRQQWRGRAEEDGRAAGGGRG